MRKLKHFLIDLDDKGQVIVVRQCNGDIFYIARNRTLHVAIEECRSYMSNFPEVQVALSDTLDDYMRGLPRVIGKSRKDNGYGVD